MPEDPLAQSEIAALTRRYEQTADALTVLKSDVLHLRLEVGEVNTRVGALEESVTALREEVRSGNAQIITLLSRLVGETPE